MTEEKYVVFLLWLFWFSLFVVFLIIVYAVYEMTMKIKNKNKQTINFKFYFQIDPPSDYKIRNLTQGYVDDNLKYFADVLNDLCNKGEHLLKNSETKRTEIGVEKQLQEFQKNQNELQQAKSNFWGAHAAAKFFCYDVRIEYKEYLAMNWEKSKISPYGTLTKK